MKLFITMAIAAIAVNQGQALNPTAAAVDNYLTTQNALKSWERDTGCTFTDSGVDYPGVVQGSPTARQMGFIHIPKSGWALKKYASVKAWVNEDYYVASNNWNTDVIVISKDEASPVARYYLSATESICEWTTSDTAETKQLTYRELGTAEDDVDLTTFSSKEDITTEIIGKISDGKTARRLLSSEELWVGHEGETATSLWTKIKERAR